MNRFGWFYNKNFTNFFNLFSINNYLNKEKINIYYIADILLCFVVYLSEKEHLSYY